jgi:pyruvate/2-oxoglutarate dehydrogenase complex dihydrolipoamide acyltransferase (E2) component
MTRRAPATVAATLTTIVVVGWSLLAGCSSGPGDPAPAAPTAAAPTAAAAAPSAAPSGSAPAGDHADSWDVSKMPDPCLTVDAAQVAKTIGIQVEKGVPLDSWPPLCAFTFNDAQEYLYVSADPRPEARADYDRQRSDSQATEKVPGIGDDAYWLPEFTALHVFRGTTHLTVKFAGSAPPKDPKAKALALARVALA